MTDSDAPRTVWITNDPVARNTPMFTIEDANADLVEALVNRAEDYEAAVDALEELLTAGVVMDIPNKYVELQHSHRSLDYARAVLRRLRGEA